MRISFVLLLSRRKSFCMLFGGIWLLLGILFLAVGSYLGIQAQVHSSRIESAGRPTRGIVVSRTVGRPPGASAGSSGGYWITYRYIDDQGQQSEGFARLPQSHWDPLEEGQRIPVTYVPQSAGLARVEGEMTNPAEPWIFAAFGAAASLLGGFVFSLGWRRLRLERRLLYEGMRLPATVTRVEETKFRINRVTQWVIHFEYRDPHGQARAGRGGFLSTQEALDWQAGDVGEILCDIRRPETTIWLGKPYGNTGTDVPEG